MSLSSLMKDTISLLKKNGEKTDGIKASVQKGKIFINRSDILIETGDLIQRKMSNGGEETYEVIDPGFYERHGGIPAHYQMDVKKLGLSEAKKATSLGMESKDLESVNTGTETIFISHAAEDAVFAKVIKTQIDDVFEKKVNVFISSLPGTINPGSDWLDKIIDSLTENNAFIVLVTPYSEKRSFVWFEIGFSWLRRLNKKCSIYAICVPPITPGNLPEPLCRLQNVSLENKKQTEEFFKSLVTQFGSGDIKKLNFSKIHKSLPKYPDAGLESILVARTIDNSGFQFKDMLIKAKKDIFLVGQSFHHLTNEDNRQIYKNLIFEELQKRDISIRILLSNPDYQKAIDVWTQVTGPEYGKDVKDAIEVFKSWMQKFKLEKDKLKGTLLIKKTHLVPLTITFCDKGLKSGSMQLTPIINQALSEIRPVCILYENEQPEIVQHYWSVCNGIFINRTKAKPVI